MAENKNLAPIWVILAEQNYAIRFAPQGYVIDFRVFAAAEAWSGADTEGRWRLIDCGDLFELEEWERAPWEIDGGLKWDGCINWQTNPECMVHGCGPGHSDEITAIFATIYHVGKRYFDLLDEEVPPLPEGAIEQPDRVPA